MSASRETPSALAVSSDAEKADVLDELVAIDHELQDRAERVARSRMSDVETDGVASAVTAALLALDQEDLAANAGRTRYGYVEPTEAAWSLLEAAVEPWLEDIARRASLGLLDAVRRPPLRATPGRRRDVLPRAASDLRAIPGRGACRQRARPRRAPRARHGSKAGDGGGGPMGSRAGR
jgi:hypothetical protein